MFRFPFELELHFVQVLMLKHVDEWERSFTPRYNAFRRGVHTLVLQVAVQRVSPELGCWAAGFAVWAFDEEFIHKLVKSAPGLGFHATLVRRTD